MASPKSVSQSILDIITQFALNKFDDSDARIAAGTPSFLATIDAFVAAEREVQTCLPSFPFKSANKQYKVLGSLPDKAEELALARLNNMCRRIREVYPPGARVTIISDGMTYNDLLSISDRETWQYGEALRKMAHAKGFNHVSFARIRDLVDCPDLPAQLREITYVANCTNMRRVLLNEHGRDDLDIDKEIVDNPDTKLTYLGYRRFLESDLKHIFPTDKDRTNRAYKRDVKYVAKQMLKRGYAFAGAVKKAFPDHLRLSIHESLGEHKVSISLLNTQTGFTTPWHCSVAQLADGEWISAPKGEFEKDARLEVVLENGRPSHFREKPRAPDDATPRISESWTTFMPAAKKFSPSSAGSSSPSLRSEAGGGRRASSPSVGLGISGCTTPEPAAANTKGDETVVGSGGSPAVDYGRRLLPQIIDERAASHPDQVLFSLSTMVRNELQFRDITARQFARAIDKTAWWLEAQVGKQTAIQPIGYIGPHDLRHVLLTYACVKVGYAALFLSPKNSTQGALAVLETLGCNIWAKAGDAPLVPLVQDVLQQRPMTLLELPTLDVLLDVSSNPPPPYPYTKTFSEATTEPFCFLHTSGSTGVPKPIPWSNGLIGTMDAVRLLPRVPGDHGLPPWTADWLPGDRIYSSFPMSHGAGIIMNLLLPALLDLLCVMGPVGVLPNITLVEALAERARVDIWSMVPSLTDEVGETPDVLAKLAPSKFICASGGPVSPVSAAKANAVVRVLNLTGTTEGLFIGNLVPAREDWFWFAFHPYSGFEFKPLDEDDTYEHWIHRDDRHAELFQGIYHTFPEQRSINFKDLYAQHPTKPYLWSFKGRNDDLVVLSNGYKISPLQTEALIGAHPAVAGCLVFGTGKPQAALLVELQDPVGGKTEPVLDSIWEAVQAANVQMRHKNQLLRDFVAFAEPDKPFARTDKGTVKRAATLALYADYIERFYASRSADLPALDVDLSSPASVRHDVRELFASYLPEVRDAPLDANLFELGLDSLAVFAAIKTLRAVTGLADRLSARQLYANPTLDGFSEVLLELSGDTTRTHAAEAGGGGGRAMTELQRLAARHRARQSFKLNAMDYVNPNHYMGLVFYFPLAEGVSFREAFDNLSAGLDRTMDLIPALGGKMVPCSEHEIGFVQGDLCVSIPPPRLASSAHKRLIYKDCSGFLPTFAELRDKDFVPSLFRDELILQQDTFPKLPADIVIAQANFVEGGCVLAVDMNHCCMDGMGVMIALKAWAENCRLLQGDASATCSWLDPDSFNHGLPEIIHEQEGWAKAPEEVDPGTWGFLPFQPAEDAAPSKYVPTGADLPPAPKFKLHSVWPLPRAERCMNTTVMEISAENIRKLKKQVLADPETKGSSVSVSDIVQAFFWRSAIRARRHAAKISGKPDLDSDHISILEAPTDGRAHFSSLLPATYMGSMLIMSRSVLSAGELCAPETSLGRIAQVLRDTAARITPSLVHDAFTLLQSLPDHTRFSTANMGLEHMHAMISNLMLFPLSEVDFGSKFFGNSGSPEAMRPQLVRGNGRFRFWIISPMKKDGAVELVLGTFPEELEFFKGDEEFGKYAKVVDVSPW
ncbi:transferase family protein [Cordyceps fumosorosea ARSEF 2679]|uniref:Transferase family protein n=1 Tax=Cordyceps fumosorosea (strain ARSEF 2679) TaxID=1081104 RepID=A0A167LV05_CORFA|nr:transferase family protein [Cordyceps fumosorosea ARSEF 2679]OAA53543.1 transferase family protein [Cordyceps fumosorosea ARSEF 2679]